MPRFLISVVAAAILSILILAFITIRTEPNSIFINFIFSIFVFTSVSLILSLFFYFLRTFLKGFIYRRTHRLEEKLTFDEQRALFRRSFKMALPIAVFIGLIVFLQTNRILNLFNLAILLAIIILGAIYLKTKS